MNRDDIIRMAEEASGGRQPDGWGVMLDHEQLERFAALVASAEREHIAREFKNTLKFAEERGAANEREACASIEVHLTTPVREYMDMSPLDAYEAALMDAAMAFRTAIRARGQG